MGACGIGPNEVEPEDLVPGGHGIGLAQQRSVVESLLHRLAIGAWRGSIQKRKARTWVPSAVWVSAEDSRGKRVGWEL